MAASSSGDVGVLEELQIAFSVMSIWILEIKKKIKNQYY